MIYDGSTFERDLTLEADLCVVGSGPGGMSAATVAAEAGLRVVLLEAGPFLTPQDMTQREEDMLPQLLWAHGGRANTARSVAIHQGKGVGGSSLHNLNLCKRIHPAILREWRATRGLSALPPERWDALYSRVESWLEVSAVPEREWNRHNRLLLEGGRGLGWSVSGMEHNRTGCVGSGFCEVGCAYDAKNNATKVLLPRFLRAGGEVVSFAMATRVLHGDGHARGVEAATLDAVTNAPRRMLRVRAPRVCLAASATGSAALLLRSEVPDPSGTTGKTLRVHPAPFIAGDFEDPVHAWRGIPQSVECTEFLDLEAAHPATRADAPPPRGTRTWIVTAFAHPMGVATLLPGLGADHAEWMQRYAHLGVLTSVLHDFSAGSVRPRGRRGLEIDYALNDEDRAEVAFGIARCAELLVAAGARRVLLPGRTLETYDASAVSALDARPFTESDVPLTAVHPMGTVPMADDAALGPVDSRGAHHEVEGLWVADGSLFPTSIGGPPQLSIYALGAHVGEHIASADTR